MLSFGGLLAEVFGGGAAGLAQSNPGIAKVLTGFVFPVGLVMLVRCYPAPNIPNFLQPQARITGTRAPNK